MPTTTERLTSLLRASADDNHTAVLAAAEAVLAGTPTDAVAHRARAVALLRLDRFHDAVRALSNVPEAVRRLCRAERVYGLYKCGRLDEAAALLSEVDPGSDADHVMLAHLDGQVAYRAGRFSHAQAVYSRLATHYPDTAADSAINGAAAAAQQIWHGASEPPGLDDNCDDTLPDAFDLCYNLACAAIARDHLDRADALLSHALAQLDHAPNMTDAERDAERLPILLQAAFVAAHLGRKVEAAQMLGSMSLLDRSPDSQDTTAGEIAILLHHNLPVIEAMIGPPPNPFLLHRRLARPDRVPDNVLSAFQHSVLHHNAAVLDLKAQKLASVSRLPAEPPSLSVLAAAATAASSALSLQKQLLAALACHPRDLGRVLLLVQTLCGDGHFAHAVHVLDSFLRQPSDQPSPAVAALAVALYRAQDRPACARAILAALAPAHELAAADWLLASPTAVPPGAAAAFDALCAASASTLAQAGVVACAGSGWEARVAGLPPAEALAAGVSVHELLAVGVAGSAVRKKRPADAVSAPSLRARKRPRVRAPPAARCKSFEPGRTPDPDRWLPLRDRSSYKPKGRKARKKGPENMQGGVVRDDEPKAVAASAAAPAPTLPLAAAKKRRGKR